MHSQTALCRNTLGILLSTKGRLSGRGSVLPHSTANTSAFLFSTLGLYINSLQNIVQLLKDIVKYWCNNFFILPRRKLRNREVHMITHRLIRSNLGSWAPGEGLVIWLLDSLSYQLSYPATPNLHIWSKSSSTDAQSWPFYERFKSGWSQVNPHLSFHYSVALWSFEAWNLTGNSFSLQNRVFMFIIVLLGFSCLKNGAAE